ncbi:glycosyltransferase [Microbacterium marinilacus]|nr:glycosyltransferase [Microbacterium marinilacus]MBY0689445.1 glycosyltransferase [Microbacterium marinilacus]
MQLLVDPAVGPKSFNPYTTLLVGALDPSLVRTRYFRWKGLLTDDFDVLHVHWPEHFTRHRYGVVRVMKAVLLLVFLVRIRLQRKAIVRTAHNLRPHEKGTWIERRVLDCLDRCTTLWFVLNDATPVPAARKLLIQHGHYRDWYRMPRPGEQVPGRLLAFGLIRAYKGMDDLVSAFRDVPGDQWTLHLCGRAESSETVARLEQARAGDQRVRLDLRFVPDEELAQEIAQSEAVVLPYRDIHNSGVALLALSLNRPVIVRDAPATRLLEQEFGSEWVHRFTGDLDAQTLTASVFALRGSVRADEADMSGREWSVLAAEMTAGYRRALTLAGQR